MAKKVQEVRRFGVTNEVLNHAIPYALGSMGAVRVNEVSSGIFTASFPVSWCSWGETVEVSLDGDASLRAQSRCVFPAQVIDWGKNKRNLERFFSRVGDYIAGNAINFPARCLRSEMSLPE